MPRTAKIYGQRTNREVSRVVKNFNARIRYQLKKNPEAASYLPDPVSVKEFKAVNTSRADVNAALTELKAFTKKTAVPVYLNSGLVRTRWEIDTVKKQVEAVNRSRKKRLRQIQPSVKRGTAKAAEQLNLMPMRFEPEKMKLEDWQYKKTAAQRESRQNFAVNQMLEYKRQYLENIQDLNLDPKLHKRIMSLINNLPPEAYTKAYKLDPVLNIKFTSDPLHKNLIAGEIYRHWLDFLGEPSDDEDMAWDEDEMDDE